MPILAGPRAGALVFPSGVDRGHVSLEDPSLSATSQGQGCSSRQHPTTLCVGPDPWCAPDSSVESQLPPHAEHTTDALGAWPWVAPTQFLVSDPQTWADKLGVKSGQARRGVSQEGGILESTTWGGTTAEGELGTTADEGP